MEASTIHQVPSGNCSCLVFGSDRLPCVQLTTLRKIMSKRQQLHCTDPSRLSPLPLLRCLLDNTLPLACLPSPCYAAGTGDSSDRVRLGGQGEKDEQGSKYSSASNHLSTGTVKRISRGSQFVPSLPDTNATHGKSIDSQCNIFPVKRRT